MISNASAFMQEQLISIVMDYFLKHEADFEVTDHEQFVITINFCAGGLTRLYREWFAGNSSLTLDELSVFLSEASPSTSAVTPSALTYSIQPLSPFSLLFHHLCTFLSLSLQIDHNFFHLKNDAACIHYAPCLHRG